MIKVFILILTLLLMLSCSILIVRDSHHIRIIDDTEPITDIKTKVPLT